MTAWLVVWLSVAPAQSLWTAPEGCPTQDEVERQTEALLLEPHDGVLEYSGRIEVTGAGYRLDLEIGSTSRTIEAAECSRLATAAALIIAVEQDPVAVAAAVEPVVQRPTQLQERAPVERPEPRKDPEIRPTPPQELPSERVRAPGPERPGEVRGTVRAGLGVELGNVPRPGAGFLVAGGVGGVRWRVELGGTASLPRDVPVSGRPQFGARAALFAGHARGCWLPGRERFQVPVCGGLDVGGLWARGFGPGVEPSARTQLWLGAMASAGLNYWISGRFGLLVDAELDVALRQPAVMIVGVDDVFRAGAVGARFVVGPILRFP